MSVMTDSSDLLDLLEKLPSGVKRVRCGEVEVELSDAGSVEVWKAQRKKSDAAGGNAAKDGTP